MSVIKKPIGNKKIGNYIVDGGGGAVDSVFSRTGVVVAANGDYTASQITNAPAGDITDITVQSAITTIDGRVQTVEKGVQLYEIYESINSNTGTVTLPTESTVLLDRYEDAGDAIVVELDANGRPIDSPVRTAAGVIVTSSFNLSGDFVLSGVPNAYPVAIVYQISIQRRYSENVAPASIIEKYELYDADEVTVDASGFSGNLSASDIEVQTALNTIDGLTDVNGSISTHIDDTTTHGTTGNIVGTSDTQVLSNKSLVDNTTSFEDNVDDTKKMKFELSGITTANTRTLTVPDADGTIALTSEVITLSKIIAASTSTTGLQITAADGVTPLMNVDTVNGRLGFGTITPAKQIDITKDIQLVNTTAADEGVIYKGSYAFFHNFSHPTGGSAKPTGRNLFVGPRAGNFTMGSAATSTDHASFNLAIGDQALLSNQLGYHNTSIGYLASALNQDGAFNIAIGAYALYANVDTDSNIGIGYSSGRSVTAGVDSIFIGSNAGFNASQKTNPDNVFCLGSGTYCTTDNTYMYGNTDVEKHIFQSGIVGMSTTSPISSLGGLDIASGGLSLILGADQTTQTTRTDDTAKYCRIGMAHYTNAEEPVCLISAGSGIMTGTKNFVHIGGGTSLMNAINEFRVYTSENIDTTTGILRMEIDSTGTRKYSTRVIKKVFSVSGIEDNTATTIFTITTPITGTQGDGAGSYSCYIRGLVTYPMSGSPQTNKPYHCIFSRSNANAAGNPGTNSAIQVLLDGAAVTTGAGRSIDSITISLSEIDDQNLAVQATIDLTTASSTTSYFFGEIEIIWNGYSELPAITVS